MLASHNFSVSYAKCLVAATPPDQLLDGENPKNADGLSPADMARMEREMETLSRDFRHIEETHGRNVLNLVIAAGYLKKLVDNARVVRYRQRPQVVAISSGKIRAFRQSSNYLAQFPPRFEAELALNIRN